MDKHATEHGHLTVTDLTMVSDTCQLKFKAVRGFECLRGRNSDPSHCVKCGEVESLIAERERSMRRKLVLWLVLLIAGFLVGSILQYAKLQPVQQELLASTKQLGSCQTVLDALKKVDAEDQPLRRRASPTN